MGKRRSEAEWRQAVADCKSSELSIKQWCEKNQVKISTYKYWHTRLNKQKKPVADICFAEMKVSEEIIEHPAPSSVTIQYESFVIDVTEKTNIRLLAEILKTLRSVC